MFNLNQIFYSFLQLLIQNELFSNRHNTRPAVLQILKKTSKQPEFKQKPNKQKKKNS